jgi:hypothetical protein
MFKTRAWEGEVSGHRGAARWLAQLGGKFHSILVRRQVWDTWSNRLTGYDMSGGGEGNHYAHTYKALR